MKASLFHFSQGTWYILEWVSWFDLTKIFHIIFMVRKENPFLCNWCWSETTEWNVILIITMHAQSFLLCFLTQNKFELLIFNCRLENWDFLSHKLSIFFVVMTANWLFFFVCVDCKNFILFFCIFNFFFFFNLYKKDEICLYSMCLEGHRVSPSGSKKTNFVFLQIWRTN